MITVIVGVVAFVAGVVLKDKILELYNKVKLKIKSEL